MVIQICLSLLYRMVKDMSDAVEALRLGASDYLVKPINDLEVLEHSIEKKP